VAEDTETDAHPEGDVDGEAETAGKKNGKGRLELIPEI
jgi:hypothetical protein